MILNTECLGNVGILVEDWDISKSFNLRTMTTDYTSWITYISRKKVPAGIELTDNEYWKPIFRVDKEIVIDYNSFKNNILREVNSLKSIVNTFLQSQGGTPLDNKLGNNELVGVTQKTLTSIIHNIWSKIEDITGESSDVINMIITPDCFYSDDGCDISISANKANATGPFEVIKFYVDDVLVGEFKDVDIVRPEDFEQPIHVDATSVIKCVAQIMGVEYEVTKTITKKPNFWIGAGNHPSDVMTDVNLIEFGSNMRASKDITFSNGNYLIIVMGAGFMEQFIRVDMNGFEIPINEPQPFGEYYWITSKSTFIAGTYNIDING